MTEPAEPPRKRSPRVLFVDVLRLIASLQMINGHTLDAIMVEAVRHGRDLPPIHTPEWNDAQTPPSEETAS